MKSSKILILGLGNILMGDEGIGIKAIEYLKEKTLPSQVELLDGGTGGFHLLSLFEDYQTIIMIDATISTTIAGEVNYICPKFASDFPRSLTSHDIGLRDLMLSAQVIGNLPDMHLITIGIYDFRQVKMEISSEIEQSLPVVYQKILEIISHLDLI